MKLPTQNSLTKVNTSFNVQTINESSPSTNQHQHVEHELILFIHGSGTAFIGEYEGEYAAGDIFFIGSNLPHTFTCRSKSMTRTVVQFRDNSFGNHFVNMPECSAIKILLGLASNGLKVIGNSKYRINQLIKLLETTSDLLRIITFLQCMELMSTEKEYIILNSPKSHKPSYVDKIVIDKVVQFTLASFHNPISLSQVSELACMSISSFCHYFKRQTKKTYINFLNEVRICFACEQLHHTNKSVIEISYESGFNTAAYFHRQFLRLKKTTPLQYRKQELNQAVTKQKSTIVHI